MKETNTTVVGMDVHRDEIVAAILPSWAERPTETRKLPNRPEALKSFVEKVAKHGAVEFVYEAGPCGFEVHRQISALGHSCWVIAPGLTPKRASDVVKTDRRDAEKLSRLWRAGELTAIRVPGRKEEAARDLVRTREGALKDLLQSRHRLSSFLLRQGRVYGATKTWGVAHREWLRSQKFEVVSHQSIFEAYLRGVTEAEARLSALDQQVLDLCEQEPFKTPVQYLRCFKGVDTITAITVLVESQDLKRFSTAPAFMKYTGLTGWEYTSADHSHRGGISKTGNSHIRRVLCESAWSYRHRNTVSRHLARRRQGCPPPVLILAQKAQDRLHRRYCRMNSRGKPLQVAITAIARELAGFLWAMSRYFPDPQTNFAVS